jgi:prolyl-tRNA synthetase
MLTSHITSVKTWKELVSAINNHQVVKAFWCGKKSCEEKVKAEASGARTINLPLEQKGSGLCAICTQKATLTAYFGKVY